MRCLLPLISLLTFSVACRDIPEDLDGDGVDLLTDCNDSDPAVYPGADEVCNGIDDNCSGAIDDAAVDATVFYLDSDGDSVGSSAVSLSACDAPAGYVSAEGDCDDSDPAIHPGASDVCSDPVDYNCDGSVGYADADKDGWPACEECDDSQAAVNPSAVELCDEIDNNCDGVVDEEGAVDAPSWHLDVDGDGFGAEATVLACVQPENTATNGADCDDTKAGVFPGAVERCDAIDDNCNGLVDEEVPDAPMWYADSDQDGVGGATFRQQACVAPEGYLSSNTDCDDLNAATLPGADELCDGQDNDCDGVLPVDESDGDGDTVMACDGDCDDSDAAVSPVANERCDGQDNDCDGQTDEADAIDQKTWYLDADADGVGISVTRLACDQPVGWASQSGDCDDGSAAISPLVSELCDQIDNNCDGQVDEGLPLSAWYVDGDSDGFGAGSASQSCGAIDGRVSVAGDCDDANARTNPGTWDRPGNGVDDNCDGVDVEPLVYSVDRTSGAVWAVNRVTGQTVWTSNMGDESIDITVGPDGALYASRYATGGLAKGTPDGASWTTLNNGDLPGVHGLNYDFERDVIIATLPVGSVVEVDPATGAVTPIITGLSGTPIDAIRMWGDERLWITTRVGQELLTYTPSTGAIDRIAALPTGGNLIVPSSDGGFYVSGVAEVLFVDVRRGTTRSLGSTGLASYGLCADPLQLDQLIVGDHSAYLHTFDVSFGSVARLSQTLGTTWGCASNAPADQDGDGYINRVFGGDDCDDFDAFVHPGALDMSLDGVDQNCDWTDGTDADGDGDASVGSGGTDCDDADPSVHYGDTTCGVARSCADLLSNWTLAVDGTYTIDPDGSGPIPSAAVMCDMRSDGGGWTLAFDDTALTIVAQDIPEAVLQLPVSQVRALREGTLTEVTLPLHQTMTRLADVFGASWRYSGFETDNYIHLSEESTRSQSIYLMDDNDAVCSTWPNPGNPRQLDCPSTPRGLISFGYTDTTGFVDGGGDTYGAYGTFVQRLWVR